MLVGFGGADTFAFTTALGGGNIDRISRLPGRHRQDRARRRGVHRAGPRRARRRRVRGRHRRAATPTTGSSTTARPARCCSTPTAAAPARPSSSPPSTAIRALSPPAISWSSDAGRIWRPALRGRPLFHASLRIVSRLRAIPGSIAAPAPPARIVTVVPCASGRVAWISSVSGSPPAILIRLLAAAPSPT